ncbi:type II secretion system protein GspK [Pseudomonas sp. dw_358]|uniref:type II secretion system protein GspK n=1 Tax=Pseudomonas sp. dw_358 TaxID=2720083 RepID=UPI001BD5B049|nr:type II secretion system protein GspK [Pseudomonas sp. dw_358]
MKPERGVALLLVLWLLALLSVLLAALAATVQLQLHQAQWLGGQTQALLAAEGGIDQAVIALQARDPAARWAADGQPHIARLGDAGLVVRVRSERGKLDLNSAPLSAVRRLLQSAGASPQAAEAISRALEQQRNGPAPVRTVEALRALPGMSFELYRAMAPLVTVWSGEAQPDPSLAPPQLARALGLPAARAANPQAGQIFTLDSEARLPDGGHAELRVTLILTSAKEGARPYRVLRWQE